MAKRQSKSGPTVGRRDDCESISLSISPGFLAIIERSRRSHKPGTGISTEEMRLRLGHGAVGTCECGAERLSPLPDRPPDDRSREHGRG